MRSKLKHIVITVTLLSLAVCSVFANAKYNVSNNGIGYPSVTAALSALKKRHDVNIDTQHGWTVIADDANKTIWSFAPENDPAYPSVAKRSMIISDGKIFIHTNILCQSTDEACERFNQEFQELDDKVRQSVLEHEKH